MKIIKSISALAVMAAFALIIGISACNKETSNNEDQENTEAANAMSSALDGMVLHHDSMIHADSSHRILHHNQLYHHHDSLFQYHHQVYHHGDMGHHSGWQHSSDQHLRLDSITNVHHNFPH